MELLNELKGLVFVGETVVKQLSGNCQEVARQLSGSCQAVDRQLSGSCQAVVRQMTAMRQSSNVHDM